jgi:hypothetical protein
MEKQQRNFIVTFSFEHENPNMDLTLKQIRRVIFIKEPEVELYKRYQQYNRLDIERTTVMLPCVGRRHQMKMTCVEYPNYRN